MLISLPNSTLLNKSTILHLYDPSVVEKLSAIQLLCLHLAIHRFNNADRDDTVEDFLPYIRTLPQDFSSVPLWREVVKDEAWLSILRQPDLIPAGLLSAIEDVSKRFWKDWKTTSDVAVSWESNVTKTVTVD